MTEQEIIHVAPEPLVTPYLQFASTAPPKTVVREYIEQGLITVVMALFLMTFIAQAVQVPTGSMQNNIHIGDHFFVNKFLFGRPTPVLGKLLPTREIKRGDVILGMNPSAPHIPVLSVMRKVTVITASGSFSGSSRKRSPSAFQR